MGQYRGWIGELGLHNTVIGTKRLGTLYIEVFHSLDHSLRSVDELEIGSFPSL